MRRILLVMIAGALISCDRTPTDPASAHRPQLGIDAVITDPCPGCTGVFLTGAAADFDVCTLSPSTDVDRDSVDDRCEYNLALAFSPEMFVSPQDDDPSRETYWVAQRSSDPFLTNAISVFYLLGYHQDTGHPSGHWGDSEFIELVIRFDSTLSDPIAGTAGRWVLQNALYSAHYQTLGDRTTRYSYNDLEYPVGKYRDNPIVWVAEDKHANYNHQSSCWSPLTPEDRCNTNVSIGRVEVLSGRNLGSEWARFKNCVYSSLPASQGYLGIECLWTRGDTFAGWRDGAEGVKPYGDILYEFGYFRPDIQ